jgi:hypothetical protein
MFVSIRFILVLYILQRFELCSCAGQRQKAKDELAFDLGQTKSWACMGTCTDEPGKTKIEIRWCRVSCTVEV